LVPAAPTAKMGSEADGSMRPACVISTLRSNGLALETAKRRPSSAVDSK
jgi:hypothetical protein